MRNRMKKYCGLMAAVLMLGCGSSSVISVKAAQEGNVYDYASLLTDSEMQALNEDIEALEEESGAEASAKELIHLIEEVRHHDIRAIFVESNGSGSAASIIAAETGAHLSTLSMAMSGDDYFAAMYANIDALKEALK